MPLLLLYENIADLKLMPFLAILSYQIINLWLFGVVGLMLLLVLLV